MDDVLHAWLTTGAERARVLSAMASWTVVVVLFLSVLVVVYQRRDVSWLTLALLLVGAMLLGFAGALAATRAIENPAAALGPVELAGIIIFRSAAAAIFVGMLISLTGRPRWLVRLAFRIMGMHEQ